MTWPQAARFSPWVWMTPGYRMIPAAIFSPCFLKYVLTLFYLRYVSVFTWMWMCTVCVCLVAPAVRRRHQVAWNWSYKWLLVIMRVLGIKLWSSVRVTSTLNHGAIFPWQSLILTCLGFRRKSKHKTKTNGKKSRRLHFCSELLAVIGSAILNA